VKFLASIFGDQAWAMHRDHLAALESRAESVSALMKAGMSPAEKSREGYNGGTTCVPEIDGDTATLELIGEMCARAPWYAKAFLGVVDPIEFAAAIDALAINAAVVNIVIEADTCGGTVAGAQDIADAIARAQAAGKIVSVQVIGMLASAGFWALCGADKITATSTSIIGAIGVCTVIQSAERMRVAAGIDTELIATGPLKGLGNDGKITDALRSERKAMVDALGSVFFATVGAGRSLTGDALNVVTTGEVWLAAQAVTLGLIDAVASVADEEEKPDGNQPPPVPVPPPLGDSDDMGASAKILTSTTTTADPSAIERSSAMDPKLLAALSALSTAHPTLAASFVAEATKTGATADALNAFAASKVSEAKDAEISATKAKLEAAETALATANTAKATAEAEVAKLKAHAPKHNDPGAGDGAKQVVTSAQFQAMDPYARGAFRAAKGTIKDPE
jgi:ClpP class serine protease